MASPVLPPRRLPHLRGGAFFVLGAIFVVNDHRTWASLRQLEHAAAGVEKCVATGRGFAAAVGAADERFDPSVVAGVWCRRMVVAAGGDVGAARAGFWRSGPETPARPPRVPAAGLSGGGAT